MKTIIEIKTKKCVNCSQIKPITDFYKSSCGGKYGVLSVCKICSVLKASEYRKTENGLISKIYADQKKTSKKRGYKPPKYSKQELQNWVISQSNFEQLWNDWVDSGYSKELVPSIDRKDDYKGYTLNNIQLMTWRENNNKYSNDIKKGKNTKNCKAILQYDLDMNFIKEYFSIADADRDTGAGIGNIWACCNFRIKYSKGFIWRYKK